jgi:hypothetical protein
MAKTGGSTMRVLLGSLTAVWLATDLAVAAPVSVNVVEPCQAVDEATYDAFEPKLRRREPRIDAFGFRGEVRAADDGLQIIQLDRGSGVAWFDAPAKAKLTHEASGETFFLISPLKPDHPNSMRLVFLEGKLECGWPMEIRSK